MYAVGDKWEFLKMRSPFFQRLMRTTGKGGNSKQAYNAPNPNVWNRLELTPCRASTSGAYSSKWDLSCAGSSRKTGLRWASGQDLNIGHDRTHAEGSDPVWCATSVYWGSSAQRNSRAAMGLYSDLRRLALNPDYRIAPRRWINGWLLKWNSISLQELNIAPTSSDELFQCLIFILREVAWLQLQAAVLSHALVCRTEKLLYFPLWVSTRYFLSTRFLSIVSLISWIECAFQALHHKAPFFSDSALF